ncbi:MAG TPA: hypothetical protein VG890_01035 [Puia sp.]|nr:hypothetical protein [Puia sp.]
MDELLKKFRFKDKAIVIGAPGELQTLFKKAGFSFAFTREKSRNSLVFIHNHEEFLDFLKKGLKQIEPDSVLWFAYPKMTSKIKTDINRDSLRETGEAYGITAVAAIAIDDTWSALRFRPVDRVGK